MVFSTTGTFAADNQFSIQITSYYSTAAKTYPLTLKNGTSTFVVGPNDFPDNALRDSFQARIIASKPATQSDAYTFSINKPVKLAIVGSTAAPINPGETANLFFSFEGTPPIDVVLTDSSRFKLNFSYYSALGSSSQQLSPATTTTYEIAAVSNACGYGSRSGSATIQVNPISLRTASVSMNRLCIGSELHVGYSVLGTLATNNKFKLRLTRASGGGSSFSEDQTRTYDLDATLEKGFLKATIPANVIVQTAYSPVYYSVRVLTSAPAATGDHAGYTVGLFAAPSAEFTTGSRTISLGDAYELGLRMKGSPPFSALLNDGTLAKVDGYEGETLQRLKPTQTTTYTIKSLQTGCGNLPANLSSSVVVTVNPGMIVDSVATGSVCEGQPVRIRIAHNFTLGSGNAFAVRLRNGSWTSDLIRAQQQGNYLTFTIPPIPTNNSSIDRSLLFSLMVSSSQPIYGTNWVSAFYVPTIPTMTWSAYNPVSIDSPKQSVSWNWTGSGGGPYELELETGQKSTGIPAGTVNVPAAESRTFQVKTLANPCYTVQNPSTATLTVKASSDRFIYVTSNYRNPVCRGDSLELVFKTTGTFQPDNKFRVQARTSSFCCDFPATWSQETTGTTIRFRVPADLSWSSTGATDIMFRIASTNPVVFSDPLPITVHQPPYNIRVNDAGKTVSLLQPTDVSQEISYLGGTPMTINYTVGGKAYSLTTLNYQWYTQTIGYPVTQDATFALTSLANACGPVSTTQTVGYKVVPYTIQIPPLYGGDYSTPSFCAGSQLSIPYLLVGQPDPSVTVSVQVRPSQGTAFQTWRSQSTGRPALVTIPDTLSAGYYTLRLVSDTGLISNEQSFQVLRSATAALSTQDDGSAISLSSLNTPSLKVMLTGSPSWTVLYSDGGRSVFPSSPGSYPISASTKTTYRIESVANACGYGKATGEVVASIKPTLSLASVTNTYGVYCKTGTTVFIPVSYSANGDFGAGNRLFIGLVDDYNSTNVRWLDSTSVLQGTFKLSLPQSTSLGNYYLRLMSTNPQLTTSTQIVLTAPPSITLGGNATINPGQTTAIRLLSPPTPGNSQAVQYTLSTGETGLFYPSPSAIFNQNVTVQPTQTTTYRVASVSNLCGTGQATGTATVTVNPPADRQVSTGTVQSRSTLSTLCAGDTISVAFSTQGVFSSSNRFTVQLSDSTGTQFTDLPTFGTTTTLKALIPTGLPRSLFYRVRVVASDNGSVSSTNLMPLTVRYAATASFADAVIPLEIGKATPVKINLTGDAPWYIQIGNEFNPVSQFTAYSSPYTLSTSPTATLTTYRLYQVANACGTGRLTTPATVQIMVVTPVEISPDHSFVLAPNPTSGQLWISQDGSNKPYKLYLSDLSGRAVMQQSVATSQHELDLSSLPAGVYVIQLRQGEQQSTHRLVKQ